jgi:type IV pilus assembly protein PilF
MERPAASCWRPLPAGLALAAAVALAAALALAACKTTTTVTNSSDTSQTSGAKSEGDPRRRAAVRLQLASGYYQKGQLDVAIKEATEATQMDPALAPAYGLLGLIYMDLAQNPQAEDNFRRALQLDPADPDLNNNFGWFLCRTRRERDALPYFDRAVANRMYATPAMALENAGICLKQVGDNDRAEKYLMRAFELDASSPIAKFQLAQLYLKTHRVDRAEFYYELLSKSVDPSAQTLWLGARIAHAKSDTRTQQRLAQELRTRFPESFEAGLLKREAFDE